MWLGEETDRFLIVHISAYSSQYLDRSEPSKQLVHAGEELIDLRGGSACVLKRPQVPECLQDALQRLTFDAWPCLKDGKSSAWLTTFKGDCDQLPIVMASPNGFLRHPKQGSKVVRGEWRTGVTSAILKVGAGHCRNQRAPRRWHCGLAGRMRFKVFSRTLSRKMAVFMAIAT